MLIIYLSACSSQSKEDKSKTVNTPHIQNEIVGDACDGCELMYVDMPDSISSVDTSEAWSDQGQKILITGKAFKIDGRTPAQNVILYYWHTDNKGYYSSAPNLNEKARRHGRIRGWVKTDQEGNYSIYSTKPKPYPNDNIPAHIHVVIKEPNIENEYYIDELVFDDDKLLKSEKRKSLENRGGSGVLRVLISNELLIAEHNIILGLNIPNYPNKIKTDKISGLEIGEDNPSFIPFHAFGPDKGTRACPVCKYGRYHGIIYFVGNNPDWNDIKSWLSFLDQESERRDQYLKSYFVYGNEKNYNKGSRQNELNSIGRELNLKNIALTYVPSLSDTESEVNLNQINPDVKNTFILYRHRTIVEKFIDLEATKENFDLISKILDKTRSKYFDLNEPNHH